MHDPLDLRDLLADELEQCRQSGRDPGEAAGRVRELLGAGPDRLSVEGPVLLDLMTRGPRRSDWPFVELDAAADVATHAPEVPQLELDGPPQLADRIHGAWLGRCIGCLVGKPVEGWTAHELERYLTTAEALPLADYVPALDPHPSWARPFKPSWTEATRGRIDGMPRDDDLDYTVLGLVVMERTGGEPTSADIVNEWLARLSMHHLFTAERAAYRNLLDGLRPPLTATTRNPYREWIGSLIRVDAYAYAAPGDPQRATRLAATDAAISHIGNGVAAAMWAAAVISLALAGTRPTDSVAVAARFVPSGTRLDRALRLVMDLHAAGVDWDEARPRIAAATSMYGWVHAIPNAATIAASLLWGAGDFARSVTLAVSAGGDTDSNGATVGSAAGALVGASALPRSLVEPLHDTVRTSLAGMSSLRVSELAARTAAISNTGNHVSERGQVAEGSPSR